MLGRQALTWLLGPVLLQTAHQTGTEHGGDQGSLGPSSGSLQNRRAHKLTPPRGGDQDPCLPKTPQRDPEQILNPTGPSGAPRNTIGSEASLPDTGETEVPNCAPWSLRISPCGSRTCLHLRLQTPITPAPQDLHTGPGTVRPLLQPRWGDSMHRARPTSPFQPSKGDWTGGGRPMRRPCRSRAAWATVRPCSRRCAQWERRPGSSS